MTTELSVSVIIPTIGRSTIEQTKLALRRQTYPIKELIVVLDQEKRGCSWARIKGFLRSSGDLIMIVDDDCIPPDDWVEKFVAGHRKHNAGVVGGTFVETDSLLQDVRKRRKFPEVEVVDDQGWVGNGGNVSIERKYMDRCLKEYGYLWDESMVMGEDQEFAWRLRSLGAKFVFIPANPIHLKTLGFIPYLKHQFIRGIGTAQLQSCLKKNPDLVPFQKSLVWSQKGLNHWSWLIKGAVNKVLGPFDIGSFSSWKNFWIFWVGSKSEVLGFLWQRLRKT